MLASGGLFEQISRNRLIQVHNPLLLCELVQHFVSNHKIYMHVQGWSLAKSG